MDNQVGGEAVLQTIINGAVAIVPGVRWAGISLVEGHAIEARVPSDPLVTKLDALQSELDQGPCISVLREQRTVHIKDVAEHTAWPEFAKAALTLGVHCSLSFQLFAKDKLGALNLYGDHPDAFDGDSVLYGEILAQHASVALAGAQASEQFDRALASRDIIGQAKGILMERFGIDDVQAFALLTRLSQETNTRLFEIARLTVETRTKQ